MKLLTKFVWYVSPVAGVAVAILVPIMYFGLPLLQPDLAVIAQWTGSFIVLLLISTIPLSLMVEPDLSSWWYRREVRRNRAKLAKTGISPEQYLASIPEGDLEGHANAKIELGIQ